MLYIDDLDRCPTERVIEVLQAIHLLLAFPLFVVVVGVDVRWASRSLLEHYPKHLTDDRRVTTGIAGEISASQTGNAAIGDGGFSSGTLSQLPNSIDATPHEYLGKIFQIPYWLRPLEQGSSQRLLRSLTAPIRSTLRHSGESLEHSETIGDFGAAVSSEDREGNAPPTSLPDDGDLMPSSARISSDPRAPPEPLVFAEQEHMYLHALAPFAGTSPRRIKRFVNNYRIVKAGIEPKDRAAFDKADFRAVLALLALTTGAPHLTSETFGMIDSGKTLDDMRKAIDSGPLRADPRERAAALGALRVYQAQEGASADQLRTWRPRISRFTFRFGLG